MQGNLISKFAGFCYFVIRFITIKFGQTQFQHSHIYRYFLDVTLACEDGKHVKAHKVVLSLFSSVFQ